MRNKLSLLLIAIAAWSMTGCMSGGDGGSGGGSLASSGSVVYLADQNTDGVFELFLVSTGAKLNGPIVAGGSGVTRFALTPDKSAVVYIAEEKSPGILEMFQVNIATPGVSVKLNGPLVLGGNVDSFAITPDGTSVVYLADQRINGVFELFRVLFSTPQASTRLNPNLVAGGTVSQFAVTPDSSKVVYIADQDTNNVNELYQVSFGNPLNSTKLNAPLVFPGGNVTNFAVTPNGISVVYLADLRIDQVFEMFVSPITGPPGPTTPLNPPLNAPQSVASLAVTPDSTAVIYRADQFIAGTIELFRVTFAAPQSITTLNGGLIAGGNVRDFTIAGNGSSVVYRADQDSFGVFELFRVALTTPIGPAQKINPVLAPPKGVTAFAITLDSLAVVYLADQTVPTVPQVYRVPFSCLQANPAPSCPQAVPPPANLPPLNGALTPGGHVSSFAVSPDSTLVFYLADQTTFGVTEFYAVNVGSPGASSKLNGQLVPGGNVTAFVF